MDLLKKAVQVSRATFFATYFISLTLSLNVLQLATLTVHPFAPKTAHSINTRLASIIWSQLLLFFKSINRAKIVYSGDDIPSNENAIVLSNHTSFTDTFLLLDLSDRLKMLRFVKFFAKDSLKYLPIFGWFLKIT